MYRFSTVSGTHLDNKQQIASTLQKALGNHQIGYKYSNKLKKSETLINTQRAKMHSFSLDKTG